jgi:adenine-specific DNA-methyltransferase
MIPAREHFRKAPASTAPAKPDIEKRELGQFFTPPALADFIATFFTRQLPEWRVIDAGAGGGALTFAIVRRILEQAPLPVSVHLTAYEVDPAAIEQLRDTLETCAQLCSDRGVRFHSELRTQDFIAHTAASLEQGLFTPALNTFNAAIVNPPYRKLAVGSPAHVLLRNAGIDVSNLYSGFLALLSRLLETDAELVAIVPRSFCNGPYFREFRQDFLSRMALRRMHVFESRSAAFSNEAVLQENIIVRAERTSAHPSTVEISSSRGDFTDSVRNQVLPWADIVSPADAEAFIRLPATDREHAAKASLAPLSGRLADLGLKASTGKVVDFRAREHLRADAAPGDHPLLYPCHFEAGRLHWPKTGGKKPNGLAVPADRTDLLIPLDYYVVVRRFSSKEERKRIVASLLDPTRLPTDTEWVGLENHLNYFHASGRGLPRALAHGLTAYLNWSVVDDYFRHFNGHTQVNATDLRSLPYPSAASLTALGNQFTSGFPSQLELDTQVAAHCLT